MDGEGGSCGQNGSLLLELRREILEVPVGLGHWSGPGVLQSPGSGNCSEVTVTGH